MPHIPDEELHAYLDQALARLRCVEIESHLDECTRCRAARDEIAALRDRTTALLARLAPVRTVPPPFAELRRRGALRAMEQARVRQRAAWAASVVVALGVGWWGSYLVHPAAERTVATRAAAVEPVPAPPSTPAESASAAAPVLPAEPLVVPSSAPPPPDPTITPVSHRSPSARPARPAAPDDEASAHLTNVGGIAKDGQLVAGGVWRNLSWDSAKEQAGDTPVRIDGLPVTEVQTQAGDSGRRPLMVVAQQLASGEVIRTIEGPVSDVSALLGTRPGDVSESSGAMTPTPTDRPGLGSAYAFRHGDRMFAVTGSLPSDSLRAMMRRLNLMMRVR
jgi:putative zinc finger protein